MTRYNTGYPVPSPAMPDVWDNNETIDSFVNSPENSVTTRTGIVRDTMFGMQKKADEQRIAASVALAEQMDSQESAFKAAQTDKEDRFQGFLNSSGYVFLGNYENGPFQFSARNQYIRYNNQYYRLNAATDVGFITTGTTAASFANDVTHFVLMDGDTLRQNLGSSDGANLIGGLPFVTPEMFGSSRGDITHDEAFRLMFAAPAVHPTRTAWAPGDYQLFDTHILPQGVTLIIDGVTKHNPVGDFTWSESNRRSDYSLFLVTVSDVAIKGSGRIENKYEAVSVDAGGDNFKFEGVTISNPDRSKSVGLSIYNVFNVSVLNCLIANNGSKGTYVNSSSTGITGRYGNGIDAGGIRGLTARGLSLIDNGGNGFWCYGIGDLTFTTNWCLRNGLSGMQYGPHTDYDGVNISDNICRENAADGIDINYTGASPVPITGVIKGNICRRNGFFNSDTTKPTADGSGVTLRNVTDYVCADNMIRDNNGVGIYCTFAADCKIHDNVIINRITLSAGMYQGFVSTDVNIHDNRVES